MFELFVEISAVVFFVLSVFLTFKFVALSKEKEALELELTILDEGHMKLIDSWLDYREAMESDVEFFKNERETYDLELRRAYANIEMLIDDNPHLPLKKARELYVA